MENIIAELTSTKEGLKNILTLFKQEQFNIIPFADSWTAGQVAEHVFKSVAHVPGLLTGPSKPTDRDPAQNVSGLRQMFLDFNTKMKSPDFILPSAEPKDLVYLSKSLDDILAAIVQAAKNADLNLTVVGFEFPGAGPTTRLELVNFIAVHTQRHIYQLKKIHDALSQSK